jgi:hypothetical protein
LAVVAEAVIVEEAVEALEADLAEVLAVAVVATVEVLEEGLLAQERCLQPSVTNVVNHVNYHSSQQVISQFIVATVSVPRVVTTGVTEVVIAEEAEEALEAVHAEVLAVAVVATDRHSSQWQIMLELRH